MDNFITKEFNLSLMKANNILESAMDSYAIKSIELSMMTSQGYFTEAEEDNNNEANKRNLIEKIKEFFKKIKDAIVDSIEKIIDKVKFIIIEKKIKKRLESYAAYIATCKSIDDLYFDDVSMPDINKNLEKYKKVFNTAVSKYTNFIKKDYKSGEDALEAWEKFSDEFYQILSDYDLDSDEEDAVSYSIDEAIAYETKYINNIVKINSSIKDAVIDAQKESEKILEQALQDDKDGVNGVKLSKTKLFMNKLSIKSLKTANKFNRDILESFGKIDVSVSNHQRSSSVASDIKDLKNKEQLKKKFDWNE